MAASPSIRFRISSLGNLKGASHMAYRLGRLSYPSEADFVIDAHYTDGRFSGEVGRFEVHMHAMSAFDAYKTTLPHMILRLRQGNKTCCTWHPQLGGASLPIVLEFPANGRMRGMFAA
jgi:hypothetical protein